jgi:hypothetical protein
MATGEKEKEQNQQPLGFPIQFIISKEISQLMAPVHQLQVVVREISKQIRAELPQDLQNTEENVLQEAVFRQLLDNSETLIGNYQKLYEFNQSLPQLLENVRLQPLKLTEPGYDNLLAGHAAGCTLFGLTAGFCIGYSISNTSFWLLCGATLLGGPVIGGICMMALLPLIKYLGKKIQTNNNTANETTKQEQLSDSLNLQLAKNDMTKGAERYITWLSGKEQNVTAIISTLKKQPVTTPDGYAPPTVPASPRPQSVGVNTVLGEITSVAPLGSYPAGSNAAFS